jgi:hypothetical protein
MSKQTSNHLQAHELVLKAATAQLLGEWTECHDLAEVGIADLEKKRGKCRECDSVAAIMVSYFQQRADAAEKALVALQRVASGAVVEWDITAVKLGGAN